MNSNKARDRSKTNRLGSAKSSFRGIRETAGQLLCHIPNADKYIQDLPYFQLGQFETDDALLYRSGSIKVYTILNLLELTYTEYDGK